MLGSTFTAKAPDSPKDHLYIVISDPRVGHGEVVLVNLSKWRADKELTCVVEIGEHRFVGERSIVAFVYASKSREVLINDALAKGLFRPNIPADPSFLAKIQAGCLASPNASKEMKRLVRESKLQVGAR
jgi:hypothetical protein